jgi:antitoxin MazE
MDTNGYVYGYLRLFLWVLHPKNIARQSQFKLSFAKSVRLDRVILGQKMHLTESLKRVVFGISLNIPNIMQTQQATLSAWGKSTAVRIPAALVKKSGLSIGQTVRLESSSDGTITVRAVIKRPKLETLLAFVTPENMPDEADISWGKPVGTEVW